MTSLKEKIEAKRRRRLFQPIQITDSSQDEQTWMGVLAALQLAQSKPDEERDGTAISNLQKQLDEAWERVRSHYADVELQAMKPTDWDAAMHEWDGEEGIRWPEALAPLLADSCVDPELQNQEWWQAQLERDTWSEGDLDSLKAALLRLNVTGIDARYPKD